MAANLDERVIWVLITYLGILPAVWVAPILYQRRCKRKRERGDAKIAAASISTHSSSEAANLEAAEKSRERLHARVSGALWQAGWMIIWFSTMPFFGEVLVRIGAPPAMDIEQVVGGYLFHMALASCAWYCLMLSVQPTEAKRISGILRTTMVTYGIIGIFIVMGSLSWHRIGLTKYAIVCACGAICVFLFCVSLAHSLWGHRCFGGEPMPPRRMLRRTWLASRLVCLSLGIEWTAACIGGWTCWETGPKSGTCEVSRASLGAFGATSLLVAVISSPSIRGRAYRWLGSLGKEGSAEQKAASVASLLGDTPFAEALSNAAARFRGQPLSTLTLEALLNNEPDASLYASTVPAKLGDVHAFASHSWSDDGNLKYEKLHEWAHELGGDGDKLVWIDKACIDQQNIDANLSCLPIFLSGCQQLLMLVGPTYTTRLWCVMELFIFMRIKDLGATADSALAIKFLGNETVLFVLHLSHFDAAKAQCRYDRDRQRLLAVIEASFGTTAPFNQLVLEVLNKRVLGVKEVSPSRHGRLALSV